MGLVFALKYDVLEYPGQRCAGEGMLVRSGRVAPTSTTLRRQIFFLGNTTIPTIRIIILVPSTR